MSRIIVGLGSNMDPAANIPRALAELAARWVLLGSTAPRATAPVGPPGQPDYVNAAALIETELALHPLKAALREIEARLGRRRGPDPFAPRPIDLDILTCNGTVVDPDVYRRDFLRVQVAELAPELADWQP